MIKEKHKCLICRCKDENVVKDIFTNDYFCYECVTIGTVTNYLLKNEYGVCQILKIINQIK